MAGNVINWVWEHSHAVNGSLIVLLAVAHEANRDGITAMSVKELAQKARLSERSVQNATTELRRSGELTVHPKAGDHGRNGYRVIMRQPARRGADIAPLTPADSAPLRASRGADIAPVQNLRGADSAPLTPLKPQVIPARGADSAPLQTSDVIKTSTGIEEVHVKEVSANAPPTADRPDVERLCYRLADRIEANGSKRPEINKRWRSAARLMLDRDGRTEQQVMAAIDWCQDHEFWRANILSMPKLREKYDQLRLQAARENGNSNGNGRKSTTNDRVQQATEMGRRVQAMMRGET